MEGHAATEGVAEHDDRALHVAQDLAHGLRVRSRSPCLVGRRGRSEPGEVECQGGQRRLAGRRDDGIEVPVGPGPAVEGEDTGSVRAGDGAEEASRRQRSGAWRSAHPAAPGPRARGRGKRSAEPIPAGRSTNSTLTIPTSDPGEPTAICRSFLPLRGSIVPQRGRGGRSHPTELPGHPTEGTTPSSPGSNRSVR